MSMQHTAVSLKLYWENNFSAGGLSSSSLILWVMEAFKRHSNPTIEQSLLNCHTYTAEGEKKQTLVRDPRNTSPTSGG